MDIALVDEAEQWLAQLIKDLNDSHMYDKTPYDMDQRIVWDFMRYTPRLQEAIRDVLRRWLFSEKPSRVISGVALIEAWRSPEFIPDLERLKVEIEANRRLPTIDIKSLDAGIDWLRNGHQ